MESEIDAEEVVEGRSGKSDEEREAYVSSAPFSQ
jgi:hypothetical protein